MDTKVHKVQLRRTLLQQRNTMSVMEWQLLSDRITTHLQSCSLFTQAKTILAYFSFRQEPDLSSLFTNTKYRWGLPRCVDKSLCWHLWQPTDVLETGTYGILEPHPNSPTLKAAEVELILIPAVACDYQGYRLGYGGGYYDRLLSSPEWDSKPTIGIVFDFAYLPALPRESWDKPLHGVCTETGLKFPTTGV